MVMEQSDIEIAKIYFKDALLATHKVSSKNIVIEQIEVNFMAQIINVTILVQNTLYDKLTHKRVTSVVYESYRSMRDELVRPRWLEFITAHNVKYRIKRPQILVD